MEVMCTHPAAFRAVFPVLWRQFGTILGPKVEQEAVPEAAWTSLGLFLGAFMTERSRSGHHKLLRSQFFSQFWTSRTRRDDFRGVLGPPHGQIWYKPRLGTPKSESHNKLRQGTEILMEIWSNLVWFHWAKSLILFWFYNSFNDFSISQHWFKNYQGLNQKN